MASKALPCSRETLLNPPVEKPFETMRGHLCHGSKTCMEITGVLEITGVSLSMVVVVGK